jgi:hypothetical protein
MSFKSYSSVTVHNKKPTNPAEGDSYYDSNLNRMYYYSSGHWLEYIMYKDDKDQRNKIRKKKIKNLLK